MTGLIIVLGFYCFVVTLLSIGWNRAIRIRKRPGAVHNLHVSVIVAVRNEEKNLHRLIDSLHRQSYKNFEIIFVDDHSTDNSFAIMNQKTFANVKVLKNKGEGKKNALTTGVHAAKGPLIAATDADCIVPDSWLNEIRFCFADEKVQMAFGGVRVISLDSFFSDLQIAEFAGLIASGAATAALGFPTMCNGANLMYRKSAFEAVNGYEGNFHVASGDDEFLMRKTGERFPGSVRFLNTQAAIVETEPMSDFSGFLRQRLRWAGKWKHNSSLPASVLAVIILVSQIATIASIISLLISFNVNLFALVTVKAILEAVFLLEVCRWMKVKWSWMAFIVLQIVYPAYVVSVGIASTFVSGSWKGRKI